MKKILSMKIGVFFKLEREKSQRTKELLHKQATLRL
jgi:hypothetical protein